MRAGEEREAAGAGGNAATPAEEAGAETPMESPPPQGLL